MKDGTELMLAQAGKYACYYLCLCSLADKPFNTDDVEALQRRGLLGDDFTVNDAAEIMRYLTGAQWTAQKIPIADYKPKEGDNVIYCWYNPRTGYNHFNFRPTRESDEYDPLAKTSVTVKEGTVQSVRILRRV
jgi:hypothetical protein